jgi:hypothetical protein
MKFDGAEYDFCTVEMSSHRGSVVDSGVDASAAAADRELPCSRAIHNNNEMHIRKSRDETEVPFVTYKFNCCGSVRMTTSWPIYQSSIRCS